MRNTPCTETFRAPIQRSLCNNRVDGAKNANLELVIVLDRRAKVDERLKELDKEIKERFRNILSGIYLSSSDELFHSKGYLVESQKYGICAVGSLNLTQKGLGLPQNLWVEAKE